MSQSQKPKNIKTKVVDLSEYRKRNQAQKDMTRTFRFQVVDATEQTRDNFDRFQRMIILHGD